MKSTSAKTLVGSQSGLKFATSPRWNRQKLLFLDAHDRCIKSVDLEGTVQTVKTLPYVPGGLGLLTAGGLIVGDAWRRKVYRYASADPDQMIVLSDVAKFCLTDVIVDNRDATYVCDVGFNYLDPLVDPVANGVIVHINANGQPIVVARNLLFPNGMAISPDNKTLIVSESLGHRLTAFEINGDGSLQDRRVWAQFQDDVKPGGLCLDQEGAIWVAGTTPGVLRVKEGGKSDRLITTKQPAFATMLGGPERRHLFICTAASEDPVVTRRVSSATIDIAEVEIPGSDS